MLRFALLAALIVVICGCSKENAFVDTGSQEDVARIVGREQIYEKLLPIKVGVKYGFIDRSGKMVVNPQFDEASHFSLGLASVCIGKCDYSSKKDESKYGYIDESGRL